MTDRTNQLLERIRLGEDSALELKDVRFAGNRVQSPSRDSLADELAAFANGRGGVCVLGVDDSTRQIAGIPPERLADVEAFVTEICNDSVEPPLVPFIERVSVPAGSVESMPILRIDVARSLWVHRSPGGYLHRVGSSKRVMPPEYLARLFQQRSQTRLISFDQQLVTRASLDDFAEPLWERFRTPRTLNGRDDLLHKLGLTREDEDGVARPTVAGVLMATRGPEQWLPSAFIQAVAYRGTSSVPEGPRDFYQLDARDITGPLDEQAMDACRFVHRNMKVAATKNMGRRDVPQFDMTAVFEAVVNAVAHRDYSVYGSKIRLRLYADRLELFSPGNIPGSMDVESLAHRQSVRNDTIASLLGKCAVPSDAEWLATDRLTFMDKRGEGVRIILDRSEALSGRTPSYKLLDDAELMLTIYGAGPNEPGDGSGNGSRDDWTPFA